MVFPEPLFTHASGVRLAYRRLGEGPPAIFVHGVGSHAVIWRRIVPALAGQLDCIAPDLMGCGSSEAPPGRNLGVASQARALVRMLDALDIEAAHWVAHDIGGGIAQIVATRAPSRVLSLTLINSVGYHYWPVPAISAIRLPIVRQFAMAIMDRGLFRLMLRRAVHRPDALDAETLALYHAPLETTEGRRGVMRLIRDLDSGDVEAVAPLLSTISAPARVVRGDRDRYLPAVISERLAADIPGAALVVVPDAGHFLQEDSPQAVVESVRTLACGRGYEGDHGEDGGAIAHP